MSFIDYRVSDEVGANFQGGPEWSTIEVPLKSGLSNFNSAWDYPRHKYVLDYTLLGDEGRMELLSAFIAAKGRLHSFRVRDFNDYLVEGVVLGTGDGTDDPMQAIKTYTFGPTTYTRPIKLVLSSTLVVTQAGSPKAVTVDPLTGLITPTTAWSNGAEIRAWFEFDVKVRFGADYYPFTRVATQVTKCTIDLVEDRR